MAWLNHVGRVGTSTAGAFAWLLAGVGLVAGVAVGCSDDAETDGAGGGTAGPTTGTGGAPPLGGMGGMPVTSSNSTGGTGSGGEAPIQCAAANEYSNITPGDCDLLQQDCPPGQTCRPVPAGGGLFTTTCQAAPGLKGLGVACNNNTECQAGLFCAIDKCSPVCCNGSPDDVPCMGGSCNLSLTYGDNPDQHVWLCTFAAQCTPLTENACPPGEGCHIEEPGVASCFPPSGANAMEGEACQYLNDCPDMQNCHEGFCRYMCDLQINRDPPGLGGCPVGQTCYGYAAGGIPLLGICEPTGGT